MFYDFDLKVVTWEFKDLGLDRWLRKFNLKSEHMCADVTVADVCIIN